MDREPHQRQVPRMQGALSYKSLTGREVLPVVAFPKILFDVAFQLIDFSVDTYLGRRSQ
jgi:hypothetical protein